MSAHRIVALIVGGFLVLGLLLVGGLALAGYLLSSRVHVVKESSDHGRGERVQIETPFGRVRVDKGSEVDPDLLDIPLYPEAQVVRDGGSARVDLDLDFADKSLRVLAVELETADPFDKVVAFYRQALPDFLYTEKGGGRVELLWQKGAWKKVVGLAERNGKTRIKLANIGEPEAN